MTQSQLPTNSPTTSILFKEAYDSTPAERQALAPDKLLPINIDIPTAVTVVLGSMPEIAALRPRIEDELPRFDLGQSDRLETYTMALSYANTQYITATHPEDSLQKLADEGISLRETLLADVTALVRRGFLSGNSLNELKGINGYKNIAVDLQVLASVLRDGWTRVQGKSGTQLEEVQRADEIAAGILRTVGLREQGTIAVAAATDNRLRAFTLFMNAYDQVRRAASYLRWVEDDADKIAPSLYAGRGHTKARTDAPPAPASALTKLL
jgi:hypothetical protein